MARDLSRAAPVGGLVPAASAAGHGAGEQAASAGSLDAGVEVVTGVSADGCGPRRVRVERAM